MSMPEERFEADPLQPFELPDREALWEADNARCAVSHAGHFRAVRNDVVAFRRPAKPLAAMRVALASSGGVYPLAAGSFDLASHSGDPSLRWIPADVDVSRLRFAHDHYDHTDPDTDPNCMFPIDRLRELAAEGVVGSVAAWHLGFMGWIPDPAAFLHSAVPKIIQRWLDDRVDAAVFSPG
jgi:D-proline reductase (dithiol) PrdB